MLNVIGRMSMPSHYHSNRGEATHGVLVEEVREEEVKQALKVMEEISRKAKPGKPVAEIIREFRDRR